MKKAYVSLALAGVVLAIVVFIAFSVFNSPPTAGNAASVSSENSVTVTADPGMVNAALTDADLTDGDTIAYASKHTTCERRWEWNEEHSSY